MSKITPFEAKQLLADYKQMEINNRLVNPPGGSYTFSAVREKLESIDLDNPTARDCDYLRALKQCVYMRGQRFERIFRTLHQIFFLLDANYTFEMAKKKARLVGDEGCSTTLERDNDRFWKEYVRPAHVEALKAA